MVDFKAMSIMAFVTLMTINIGFMSFNASDTGINLFGYDTNSENVGFSKDWTALTFQQQFEASRPTNEDTNTVCSNWLQCSVAWVGDTTTELIGAGAVVMDTVGLAFKMIFDAVTGFPLLMDYLATEMEGATLGPIHLLFGTISISVTALAALGLVNLLIEIKNAMRL